MSQRISISNRILAELKKESKSEIVYSLAEEILMFEMQNWKLSRPRYKKHFEKLIVKYSVLRDASEDY